MPQGRIILKSISQSKKLALLKTDGARLLYTWLIPNADVNGCFSGDPQVIKGQIFTRLNHSYRIVELYLQDLENIGLIIRYEVSGDRFLYLPDFVDKQPSLKPEREGKPTIPLPTPEQLQSKSGLNPSYSPLSKVKESKEEVKESKEAFSQNSSEFRLAFHLFNLILKRKPTFKKPNMKDWAKQIDLMIRIDKRKPNDILNVILWCQSDPFWQNNILSTAKLRKQFDQLELKMKAEPKPFSAEDLK